VNGEGALNEAISRCRRIYEGTISWAYLKRAQAIRKACLGRPAVVRRLLPTALLFSSWKPTPLCLFKKRSLHRQIREGTIVAPYTVDTASPARGFACSLVRNAAIQLKKCAADDGFSPGCFGTRRSPDPLPTSGRLDPDAGLIDKSFASSR